jgi:hypothetical protein
MASILSALSRAAKSIAAMVRVAGIEDVLGKHVIDTLRRPFSHTSPSAAGTDRPALSRERHQPIQPARPAAEPGEAVREPPAPQELPKRPIDELRQAGALPKSRRVQPERLEVVLDDAKEHALRLSADFLQTLGYGFRALEATAGTRGSVRLSIPEIQ